MYGHIDYCKASTFVLSKISNVVELVGSRLNVIDNKSKISLSKMDLKIISKKVLDAKLTYN
jgi:hypothetical protein